MAFGKEWYERRKQIVPYELTGSTCVGCGQEIMRDTNINVSFCACGSGVAVPASQEKIAAVG
jgi:hypothetical protein